MKLLFPITLVLAASIDAQGRVDFGRDVQPILAENCYRCHGRDENARKAGLRLDTLAGATADLGGYAAVVPGKPETSRLLDMVTAARSEDRMPPSPAGKPPTAALTASQIETLRAWIAEGAVWGEHWSLVPPRRSPLPKFDSVPQQIALRNAIDHFVLARLQKAGLTPSPQADRRTLIRRLSFDLTGLPPSPGDVTAFLADRSPDAFERVVDRLLASPHYGERMAMVWLDAARYSDTDGYQADSTRSNWPWRDWVVDAYNRNLPFDQFTTLQFAGDLLPNAKPNPESVLATCFHRNHMTNGEGGRDAEESRVDYVMDRVNTTGTVFLGITVGCAQCHDHKYDPISQRDYYRLSAFFNSIDENGNAGGGAKPFLKVRSKRTKAGVEESERWWQSRRAALREIEAKALGELDAWLTAQAARIAAKGHRSWSTVRVRTLRSTHGSNIRQLDDHGFAVTGPNPRHDDYVMTMRPKLARITGMRLRLLPRKDDPKGGWSLAADGHAILTNLKVVVTRPGGRQVRELKIRSAVADYSKKKKTGKAYGPVRDVLDDDPRTGWSTEGSDPTEERVAVFAFASPIELTGDQELGVELRHRSLSGNASIRRFRIAFTAEVGPAIQRVGTTPFERLAAVGGRRAELDDKSRAALRKQFLAARPAVVAARESTRLAKRRRDQYRKAHTGVQVMVLADRKQRRTTHILKRGAFGQHGDRVAAGTPEALGAWTKDLSNDRLGLARWLVSGRHPLTARVAVNRYWQMYFGAGLLRTPEDFGLQGEEPTHPALLDWLAVEFVASGWNVKHLQKLIVMSATYRQQSKVSAALLQTDPQNRLLARASRFRMPSWMIRDAALAVSGLLSPRLGGPPVYPYQPPGVWAMSTMGRFHYQRSVGDDLYRRGIYTFWRRLIAPTAMFDASKRRSCQIRVVRTNTPLHALTLMNDTTFVEAARVLAGRVLRAHRDASIRGDAARIGDLFERVLSRGPTKTELRHLTAQLQAVRDYYRADRAAAATVLSVGDRPVDRADRIDRGGADIVSHAAFTILATTVLNLDESMTRE